MDNLTSLQELFNRKLFRVPDYQRGYSWRNQQLEEFWDDLLCLLPNQDHYTGMLSLREIDAKEITKEPSKWVDEDWLFKANYHMCEIVDGQQRLTTFIILLNEIINYCRQHGITVLNEADKIEDIESQYLFKNHKDRRTYIFSYEPNTKNPSYKYFKAKILNDPTEGSTNETLYTLNLNNAKEFFKNKLKNLTVEEVEEIYKKITGNLKFNIYNIKDNFNVFVAFETMNNRGKPLSCLELLKNRLIYLSTIFKEEENQKELTRRDINETWKEIYSFLGKNKNHPLNDDEFLQHHWMIYFGYQTRKIQGNKTIQFNTYLLKKYFTQQNINKNNLKEINTIVDEDAIEDDINTELITDEEYEPEYETTQEPASGLTLTEINRYTRSLRELIQFWYQTFEPASIDNPLIIKYLFRLNILGYVNARPLVSVILSKNEIDDETKVECLRLIERFNFLHYRLNNYASTYNSTVFYNLARDLYYNTIDIETVLKTISKIDFLSSNNVVISQGPIDKFNKLMKRDGYYSWGTLKYLLYIYDIDKSGSILATQRIKPDEYFRQDPKDQCSIEHIYPQTPTDEYWISRFKNGTDEQRKNLTGSLGNLLPLSLAINKKLQNMPFDDKKNGNEKRQGYKNGSSSEIEVAQNDEWTPKTILERGMKILTFTENEFDFKYPNDLYRKEMLGLKHMATKEDENSNATEPIQDEEINSKERVFDESEYQKLYSITESDLTPYILSIHEYCLSMSKSSTVYTTPNYVGYMDKQVFLELHFHKDHLSLMLYHGEYDDPEGKTKVLNESYRWSKNVKLDVFPGENLNYIKHLIKQSYDHTMRQ